MKRSGLPTVVLLFVVIAISYFVGLGFYKFQKDVAAMQAASVEDITWTSSQLEMELARFREALISFQITGSGVDTNEVNNRFDILWSRISLFQHGRVGARLAKYDHETQIVARLFDRMKAIDRQIVDLKEGDTVIAAALIAEFMDFPVELSKFSRLVTLGEETQGRLIRERLEAGINTTMWQVLLAAVFGLATLGYINSRSVHYQKIAKENKRLATLAEQASQAKSQFLTMMSHELRTPMNGVLGLLAIIRQNGQEPEQQRLVEQAEISAERMVGLLADILDFSALQSEDLKVEGKPFDIKLLVSGISKKFEIQTQNEDLSFAVSISGDCPYRIIGDYRRVLQTFIYLAEYILETAGVQGTTLDIQYADGNLIGDISFSYNLDGEEWTPDLLLGVSERQGDSFATDALGPALARGIINAMGGNICVNTSNGRISVVTTIPAEEFEVTELCVRILAKSDALTTVCRAAISGKNVVFYQNDTPNEVHMVLIETGSITEDEHVSQASVMHPNALIVALGTPLKPLAFDAIFDLPLNFQNLRTFVAEHIVRN